MNSIFSNCTKVISTVQNLVFRAIFQITNCLFSADPKHPLQYAVASPSSIDHGEISEISSFERACPTSPGNGEISELSSFERASSIARTEDYHTAEG